MEGKRRLEMEGKRRSLGNRQEVVSWLEMKEEEWMEQGLVEKGGLELGLERGLEL
ncbi:hypothetical protein NC652_006155 [Populus alba x Populus x berolinensis]|nr:hypothetical protein NC652_006155 [Populus alba x Populus x berolinensis]